MRSTIQSTHELNVHRAEHTANMWRLDAILSEVQRVIEYKVGLLNFNYNSFLPGKSNLANSRYCISRAHRIEITHLRSVTHTTMLLKNVDILTYVLTSDHSVTLMLHSYLVKNTFILGSLWACYCLSYFRGFASVFKDWPSNTIYIVNNNIVNSAWPIFCCLPDILQID